MNKCFDDDVIYHVELQGTLAPGTPQSASPLGGLSGCSAGMPPSPTPRGVTPLRRLRVVYICTSNVCRSPVAASIAQDWVRRHVVDPEDVEVVSAGLTDGYSAWASPAEPRMVAAAAAAKAPPLPGAVLAHLAGHASRALARDDVEGPQTAPPCGDGRGQGASTSRPELLPPPPGAVVHVVMTSEQVDWVADYLGRRGLPQQPRGRTVQVDASGADVPDPWFGDASGYAAVLDHLRSAVPESLAELVHAHGIPTMGASPP